MTRPPLSSIVENLPATVPFVGPEVMERRTGIPFRARLGANESGFGPSPKVIASIAQVAPDVWAYGDSEVFALREALGRHLGVPMDAIRIGEGIDGLLGLICRLYLDPGDRVVTSRGAYPTFTYHVAAQGAERVEIPYENDRESLSGLIDAARAHPTRIVYLANPDNPMGTWWPETEIADFIAAIPQTTMIVLDEAYGETAPEGTMPPFDLDRPNLLRLRTFSKAYGLAGMRIGYVVGEPGTVAALDRIRNHFGVTRLSQAAALAALADQDYLRKTLADIAAARAHLAAIATRLGLSPIPSATNFLAIDCGGDGAHAAAILEGLLARGIFVRKPFVPILDRTIRISVGPIPELDLAAQALEAVLAER